MNNRKEDDLIFEAYKKSKQKKEKKSEKVEEVEEKKDVCNCYGDEICEPCKRKKAEDLKKK